MLRVLPLLAVSLAACATIPEAAPHARAPSTKTSRATEVCWLETASTDAPGKIAVAGWPALDTWHATASALLVKHPDGDILVDTGASPTLDEDLAEVSDFDAFLIKYNSGLMPRRGSLPDELAQVGAKHVRIVLSHVHPDHAGGVGTIGAPILLPDDELAFAKRASGTDDALPAHVRHMRGRVETFRFDSGPYETFDVSKDLYGDGSVVLVPMPGHTPGSVGTFVTLASGRRIFHVGDIALVLESIETKKPKGALLSLITDVDAPATEAMLAKVAQLHALDPSLIILPAHDRDQWAKAVAPRAVGGAPVCAR